MSSVKEHGVIESLGVDLRQYASPTAAKAQFGVLVKVIQTCHTDSRKPSSTP